MEFKNNILLFQQLCLVASALHFMEGKNLFHLDIKPSNILYDDVKKIYPDKYKFPITLREKVDDNEDEFEILEKIKSKKLKSSGNEKEKKKEKTFCQNWIIDMLDKGSLDKFVKFFNF